jgi:hypothetical protein
MKKRSTVERCDIRRRPAKRFSNPMRLQLVAEVDLGKIVVKPNARKGSP